MLEAFNGITNDLLIFRHVNSHLLLLFFAFVFTSFRLIFKIQIKNQADFNFFILFIFLKCLTSQASKVADFVRLPNIKQL